MPVKFGERVHQAAIEGLLFRHVVVILIGGGGFGAVQAEGVGGGRSVYGRLRNLDC